MKGKVMNDQIFRTDGQNITFNSVRFYKICSERISVEIDTKYPIDLDKTTGEEFIKQYNEWLLLPKEPTIIIKFDESETPIISDVKDIFFKIENIKDTISVTIQNGVHYVNKTVYFKDSQQALENLKIVQDFIISGNKRLVLNWVNPIATIPKGINNESRRCTTTNNFQTCL